MTLTDHARQMIRTAWTLGARKDLADLRLRAWAHMLGFRGHFSTKTRRYSTTLGALRTARAEWRRLQAAIVHGDQTPCRPNQTVTTPPSSSRTGPSPEPDSPAAKNGSPPPLHPTQKERFPHD